MNCEALRAAWSLYSGAKIGGFFVICKGWGGKYGLCLAFCWGFCWGVLGVGGFEGLLEALLGDREGVGKGVRGA